MNAELGKWKEKEINNAEEKKEKRKEENEEEKNERRDRKLFVWKLSLPYARNHF